MDGSPPTSAWLALAGLWLLVGMGVLFVRHLGPDPERRALAAPLLDWLIPTATLVACGPMAIAILIVDAPWQTAAWSALLAPPAALVLGVTYGIPIGLALNQSEWRPVAPEHRRGVLIVATLIGLAAVCVPAGLALAALTDADLRLVTALSLSVADLLVHLYWALVRHWSAPELAD